MFIRKLSQKVFEKDYVFYQYGNDMIYYDEV